MWAWFLDTVLLLIQLQPFVVVQLLPQWEALCDHMRERVWALWARATVGGGLSV